METHCDIHCEIKNNCTISPLGPFRPNKTGSESGNFLMFVAYYCSCGKVMFSQVSVILFTGEGVHGRVCMAGGA